MTASKSRVPYFTPAEYLARERESNLKHEYRQGLVFAMAGAKYTLTRMKFTSIEFS